mmetsp:Transcript_71675/g.186858  ORF Transcript_71675/g.186858 Transcript_71675/m.186858 type:complete len:251 (+) Transcript_71675:222-974(+)
MLMPLSLVRPVPVDGTAPRSRQPGPSARHGRGSPLAKPSHAGRSWTLAPATPRTENKNKQHAPLQLSLPRPDQQGAPASPAQGSPAAFISPFVAFSAASSSPRTFSSILWRTRCRSSGESPQNANEAGRPLSGSPVIFGSKPWPRTTGMLSTFRTWMLKASPDGLKAKRASPSHWKKTPWPGRPTCRRVMSRRLSVWNFVPGFLRKDRNLIRYMSTHPSLNVTGSRVPHSRVHAGARSAPWIMLACQLML